MKEDQLSKKYALGGVRIQASHSGQKTTLPSSTGVRPLPDGAHNRRQLHVVFEIEAACARELAGW